jgi:SAM-dependent methyltransferase
MLDPQRFWADPVAHSELVDPGYIKLCLPEAYYGHKDYSIRLLRAIHAHNTEENPSILELGCSVGRNLHYLLEAGYTKLTGIEINPDAVARAMTWVDGQNVADKVSVIEGSIENYLAEPAARSKGIIFTQSVLMHLPPTSEWVFEAMKERAASLIVVHEVEKVREVKAVRDIGGDLRWARNYRSVFEDENWDMIEMTKYWPLVLRVFRRRQ